MIKEFLPKVEIKLLKISHVKYCIAHYFRMVFIFGYFKEILLFENKFLGASFYKKFSTIESWIT